MDISPTAQPPAATVAPVSVSAQKRAQEEKDRVAQKQLESAVDATKNSAEARRSSRRGERVNIKA
jgi:hypothetical protein